jgi:hypothetical protein
MSKPDFIVSKAGKSLIVKFEFELNSLQGHNK